jgi:hypothetical protein
MGDFSLNLVSDFHPRGFVMSPPTRVVRRLVSQKMAEGPRQLSRLRDGLRF